MSTDRTSDQSALAPAARSAHLLRVAGRRRRLGVRVAMAGTLAGLITSIAVPAMAATGGVQGTSGERVAVTATAAASQHHPKAPPKASPKAGPKASPKSTPKTPKAGPKTPKAAPKASVEGWQVDAFYDVGYGYADAQVLAGYWGLPSAFDAKLAGGAKVKAGLKLPFPPKAAPKTSPKTSSVEQGQIDAFYDAGYGYADAQVLAGYWGLPTVQDAKLAGGAKVKAGLKLPFPPKTIPKTSPKTVAHR